MHTITCIRKHINLLPPGVPFATRHFLSYGSRGSVDQALHYLVKKEHIIRLARGVFVRLSNDESLPSIKEIAATKALAFGKKIFTHALDAAYKLGIAPSGNEEAVFSIIGKTTSFQSIFGRIILKGTTSKDAKLEDKLPGLLIRAIRHMKDNGSISQMVNQTINKFGRIEKQNIYYFMPCMPSWMSDNLAVNGLWGHGIWAAPPVRKDWHALHKPIMTPDWQFAP